MFRQLCSVELLCSYAFLVVTSSLPEPSRPPVCSRLSPVLPRTLRPGLFPSCPITTSGSKTSTDRAPWTGSRPKTPALPKFLKPTRALLSSRPRRWPSLSRRTSWLSPHFTTGRSTTPGRTPIMSEVSSAAPRLPTISVPSRIGEPSWITTRWPRPTTKSGSSVE